MKRVVGAMATPTAESVVVARVSWRHARCDVVSGDSMGSFEGDAARASSIVKSKSSTVTRRGVIAYLDGAPAGWTRVMPRSALPAVLANRALRRILTDDPSAWWVTCFAIDKRARSRGVATVLLDAAVAHARDHGATAIEAHPVDTDALKARQVSGSALFTGTMRMFASNGFAEIGRTYPSRPVMRRQL